MKIKDYGIINLELDADTAPITVTNFINLVQEGFYNKNTIHRVQKDFVIQGGIDNVGSKKTIKGEFDDNGVSNNKSHVLSSFILYSNDEPNDSFKLLNNSG